MEIFSKKYLNIYGKIMEKLFFAIDQFFLKRKKRKLFSEKTNIYWLTFSNNQ